MLAEAAKAGPAAITSGADADAASTVLREIVIFFPKPVFVIVPRIYAARHARFRGSLRTRNMIGRCAKDWRNRIYSDKLC